MMFCDESALAAWWKSHVERRNLCNLRPRIGGADRILRVASRRARVSQQPARLV